jgi:hypothetical protein
MAYLDGVKVGDTLYLWEKPVVVEAVKEDWTYAIEIGDLMGSFTMGGEYLLGRGPALFWQPVPQPVPPPKPKQWVTKEVCEHDCGNDQALLCTSWGAIPEFSKAGMNLDGSNHKVLVLTVPRRTRNVRCTYEVEE